MFENYIRVACRNLVRNKLYSVISILGLAIGLAGCLLIIGYISHELSFESCHKFKDRIYRVDGYYVVGESHVSMANISPPIGPAMRDALPEIEFLARFRRLWDAKIALSENLIIEESKFLVAESDLLNIFAIPLKEGNPKTALEAPFSVIISEQIKNEYFRNQNPVGKTIKVNDEFDCQITGVFQNLPDNTQLKTNFIASYTTLEKIGEDLTNWMAILNDYTYLLLQENADPAKVEQKIPALLQEHMGEDAGKLDLRLQSLKRIYLHSNLSYELPPNGDLTYIYIFSCIAVIILVIASINFINLATARTSHRMKEVGVRKVLGAFRPHLVRQFLSESLLITIIAMVLGIILFELALPQLEAFLDRDLAINIYNNPAILMSILAMIIVVGLLSGSYPAFILSKFQPNVVLRGGASGMTSKPVMRRILVALQFTIAIILVSTTFLIYKQIQFAGTTDMGFDKENIVILSFDDKLDADTIHLLKKEIIDKTRVSKASAIKVAPGGSNYILSPIRSEHKPDEEPVLLSFFYIDSDFLSTFDIDLLDGRNFSEEIAADADNSLILNEVAVKTFELDNPVGARLLMGSKDAEYNVIGVVKDFHNVTLRNDIPPLALRMKLDGVLRIAVKLPKGEETATLAEIKDVYNQVIPSYPLDYTFLDDHLRRDFEGEQKMGTLFTTFSMLAIFVACLGLFGLAAFMAERRTKEIGIRKVLGATVSSILQLLYKEFFLLIIIANCIACPVAYYMGNQWLQSFAYKTPIGWTIFALSGCIVLAIALLTVSYQAIRAAGSNPTNSLRYE